MGWNIIRMEYMKGLKKINYKRQRKHKMKNEKSGMKNYQSREKTLYLYYDIILFMLKQRLFYFCLFILMSYFVTAQELRCNISVSSQKIQGTNRELFTNIQRDMYEFLNNKRWSENVFQYEERIECSIQITLDEQIGSDQFRGMGGNDFFNRAEAIVREYI